MGIIDHEWGREKILPELSLVVAMIQGAAIDLHGSDRAAEEKWFRSEKVEVGSFHWCCEMLNLDPARIGNAILSNRIAPIIFQRFNPDYISPGEKLPNIIGKGLCLLCGWNVGVDHLVCTSTNEGNPTCVRRNPCGKPPTRARAVKPCVLCESTVRVKPRKRKHISNGKAVPICDTCFGATGLKEIECVAWRDTIAVIAKMGGGPVMLRDVTKLSGVPKTQVCKNIQHAARMGCVARVAHGIYGLTEQGWSVADEEIRK